MKNKILYVGDQQDFRREQFADWYPEQRGGGRSTVQCRYDIDLYALSDASSLLSRLGPDSPYLFVFLDLPGERFLRAETPGQARLVLEQFIASLQPPKSITWEELPKCIQEHLKGLGFEK